MSTPHTPLQLSRDEQKRLESLVRSTTIPQGQALRAKIVLLAAAGNNNPEVARLTGVSRQTVIKWRARFAKNRLQGLQDKPRSGKPATYTAKDRERVLIAIGRQPKDATHWSVRALAEETGIGRQTVHRILKAERLKPHLTKSWVHSTDPEFETKALDVIGLYLDPPENVLVLSVDEKTCIQALDRTEPILPDRGFQNAAASITSGTARPIYMLRWPFTTVK